MWLAVVVAVFLILVVSMFGGEKHPLDKLPGYYKFPVLGNFLIFLGKTQRDTFLLTRESVRKFGDRFVMKVMNRRVLHLSTPEDVEIMLSNSQNISKGNAYEFLKSWMGTGLLVSTGTKWHTRRKILTPTFHFNVLKNFLKVMHEHSVKMVDYLADTGEKEIDLVPMISDFTLQTICETAMGTQLENDKSSMTLEYKKAILKIGELLIIRLTRVWYHVDFILRNSSLGKQYQRCVDIVHSFPDKVIKERKENLTQSDKDSIAAALGGEDIGAKKRMAMLDLLLEAESKGQIDLEGIREEVNTFMFEGHDTVSMALTFALMLLADHEDVQKRIYEEYISIFGESDKPLPSMSDLANMKYLDVVIKETLRLYPSVPFISRNVTEDFMLGDLLVKKGVEVGVHLFDLHRRKDMFPEPEVFNPDRFLKDELKHNFAYVPFSAGPRNCIGQRFAIMEMKCILSQICRNFTLSRTEKGKLPALISDIVLRPAEPIYVKFTKRNK